jgi:hypothetical protein
MGISVEIGCIQIEDERDDFGTSAPECAVSAAMDLQREISDSWGRYWQ